MVQRDISAIDFDRDEVTPALSLFVDENHRLMKEGRFVDNFLMIDVFNDGRSTDIM